MLPTRLHFPAHPFQLSHKRRHPEIDSPPPVVVSPVSPPASEGSSATNQNATTTAASTPQGQLSAAPSTPGEASSQTISASVPGASNPISSSNTTVPAAAQTATSRNDSTPSAVASPVSPEPSQGSRAADQNATTDASTPQGQPSEVAPSSSDNTESTPGLPALDPNLKTVFKVKYVAEGAAYLDGGRSSGLTEGMKLEVKESDLPMQQGSTASASDPRVVAELEVVAVTETSAVTDIHDAQTPGQAGRPRLSLIRRRAGSHTAAHIERNEKVSDGRGIYGRRPTG